MRKGHYNIIQYSQHSAEFKEQPMTDALNLYEDVDSKKNFPVNNDRLQNCCPLHQGNLLWWAPHLMESAHVHEQQQQQ